MSESASVPAVVEQHQRAAAEAQARGDSAAANAAYAAELAVRSGTVAPVADAATDGASEVTIAGPNGSGEPVAVGVVGTDEVANARIAMSPWSGWNGGPSVDELFSRWGPDAGANLAYAEAFEDTHGDVAAVIDKWGLSGHPGVVEAAAILGRRMATESGAQRETSAAEPQPALEGILTATSREAIAEKMREFNQRIERAQAAGDSPLANTIYQDQQRWIAATQGNRPVVGAGGRYA